MTSIIIGCYNVAPWLREKRLMDIRQQSDANIEIILVDDGSTDDTPVLLQALAEEDSRIRVITKENGGLGSARNAGLEAARGKYIWFYDVDDEAEPHLVEKNVEWMTTHHTQLNIFSFKATTPAQHLTEDVIFEEQLVESNDVLHDIFLDKLFFVRYGNGFAWNKFYKRSFLENHGIRFGNQRIQQDELFNLQIYPLAQRVYISSEPLYHYYIYEQGNARSQYIPHRYAIYRSILKESVISQKNGLCMIPGLKIICIGVYTTAYRKPSCSTPSIPTLRSTKSRRKKKSCVYFATLMPKPASNTRLNISHAVWSENSI